MDDFNTNDTIDELIDGLTDKQANKMVAKMAVRLVGKNIVSLEEIANCLYDPQPDAELDYMDCAGLDLLKIVNCLIKWTMDTICHFDKNAEAMLREDYDAVMSKWHEDHGEESPFIAYKE